MVAREAPDARELVYSLYAVVDLFTFRGPGNAFIHIVAYEKHVNLGFNDGASLPDPHRLIGGTGKRIRHIRIASEQDLKKPLLHYIRAAIRKAARPIEASAKGKRAPSRG
jgi:hypothetical protein